MGTSKNYENKMIDTMVLIRLYKENYQFPFCFCELSVYEMLKNKTSEERKRQFRNIDNFVKSSKAIPYLSVNNNVFDNRNFDVRFKEVIQLCEKCSLTVALSSLDFLSSIVELLFIKKYKKILNEDNKNFFERICYTIVTVRQKIYEYNKSLLVDAFFNNNKKELNLFIIKMINIFIEKINEFCDINRIDYKLEEIDNLNTNGIVVKNKIKFEEKDIDWFIEEIVTVEHNAEQTKKFFKAYLKRLLLTSGTFEVNDIVDMNISFAALSNGLEFVSDESSIYSTILNNI